MSRISYRFLVPGWIAKPLVSAHDRIMGTHTPGRPASLGTTAKGGHDTARPTPAATQVLASVGRGQRRVVFESMSAERLLCERGVGQN